MPVAALSQFRTKTASVLYDCRHFFPLPFIIFAENIIGHYTITNTILICRETLF
ncbi:hypothetical protein BACUNI_01027 [Bacteroides uniformis ATCC 8492]|uniref:Uncharacterized protein n=1 Tax=Bacteroides uniformis (strain ATCC 8492 / DSM 6597 / CCUG 4942 / CIP 103695 / JCM 5828 / KCTC 5204 / NCTC 13054 / VPI 0061) TaxID=411479 RepID=A0ABC9NF40_BACUC|nr:hypothetical protein BACUNI_01027 [Bacteroides uniformis ATCC 8492]